MSILIKGLHKPDENHGCPFVDVEYGYCLVDLGVTGNGEKCERMKDRCPLIELPDHGDLVDMDEFSRAMYHEAFEVDSEMQKWESGCWIRYKMFERLRDSAPVVIPAERSEE